MKKLYFALGISALALMTSSSTCNKGGATSPTSSYWELNTVTYNAQNVDNIGSDQIMAEDANGNSLQLFFHQIPTASHTYTIVDESKAYPNTLGQYEMAVEANVGANDVYLSTGLPASATATVNVDGNKVQVTFSTIKVAHRAGAGVLDTTSLDGSVKN